mmetsp:Transcript_9016/g.21947  ORF Transcript_9016/g.21947 Transcript_9016/m.21947 type:complete len:585 (-) Transcript_9016:177-1931(-)
MQIIPLGCNIFSRRSWARQTKSAVLSSFVSLRRVSGEYQCQHRCFSFGSACADGSKSSGERLRVAVVGGGAAGLSTALHLAPLVTAGLIGAPIDVYDTGERQPSPIGVGIWSTALYAFRDSKDVDSHQIVFDDMLKKGTLSERVGFRSPRGDWLAESNLEGDYTPDFLFLRESDMIGALQKGVHHEIQLGNVALHTGPHGKVHSIAEDSPEPWSAPLLVQENGPETSSQKTERDYHLIVAADGMNSVIRKIYGGHVAKRRRRFLGTGAMGNESDGPLDLPDSRSSDNESLEESWDMRNHAEATGTQDRKYHVFRGNSPVTRDEVEGLEEAFQTWGESRSMRFATVPMEFPSAGGKKEELHTWFITTDDERISSETDAMKRKAMLLEAFGDWHDPIRQLVEATPADEILMDRAMAHKHSCEPVIDFNRVVHRIRKKPVPAHGKGPVIQFVGDSFMTVDPILAQGFTFGMEGAAAMADSLASCLDQGSAGATDHSRDQSKLLAFNPHLLRKKLLDRHDQRLHRLICLLRSSEVVQALGQPTKGSLAGWISRCIIRPAMRVTPGFLKTPIFNRVMEYSLGLHSKIRK